MLPPRRLGLSSAAAACDARVAMSACIIMIVLPLPSGARSSRGVPALPDSVVKLECHRSTSKKVHTR